MPAATAATTVKPDSTAAPPRVVYAAATLRIGNARVWLLTHGAHQLIGWLGTHPETRKPWWFAEGKRAGLGVPLAMWMRPGDDYARRARPQAVQFWAPLDPPGWKHPLPGEWQEVPHGRFSLISRVPSDLGPPEPADPHRGSDGWPFPGLALGERVPPRSLEECEARLLRALRTQASRSIAGHGHMRRSFATDMPSEMIKIAIKYADAERLASGDVTSDDFQAVRSAFTPSRRDLTDWDYAMEWLRVVTSRAARVIGMRAADPQFSWRQVADHTRVSHAQARMDYAKAMTRMFEAARKG